MNSNSYAVEVTHLSKIYRDSLFGGHRFQALNDVSLAVPQGEIFGLLGPNGAGKTTLLKILLGIIQKTTGAACMLGLPAGSRAARTLVGYLPEHLRIAGHHTVLTALDLYGQLSNLPPRIIRQRRDAIIDLVGLTGRINDPVKKFSKGMLQRLGLAQALLVQPKLLILDEPTDGLDPRGRAEIRALVRTLKESGVTVFLNSHILQEVELVCDRVAILDRGQLKYCGSVKDASATVRQSTAQALEVIATGDPREIQRIGAEFGAQQIAPLPHGEHELVVPIQDQTEVDRLVDQLRSRGISIVSLSRKKASLEEAFLAILESSDQ